MNTNGYERNEEPTISDGTLARRNPPEATPRVPITPRPSLYQRRVLEFVRCGIGHGVVRATAGSGKTTTLVQVAASLPSDLRVCFLAFAKDAANELKTRLPGWVEARTVHSVGMRTLNAHLKKRDVRVQAPDDGKYRALVRAELDDLKESFALPDEKLADAEMYLLELVRFARFNLTQTKNENAIRELTVRYNLTPPEDTELEAEVHKRLSVVLRRGCDQALAVGLIDYTDMLYLPWALKLRPRQYDFVCIDEAQDYSALALEFTMRLVGENGRLLFVGDPRQSIFGFAGADTDALDRIVAKTQATVLPLSITYRCPTSHVALAQLIAPEMEASSTAIPGRVFWVDDRSLEKWVRAGDMIICRMNGPLVVTCLRLVRAGKRAFVRGRDLATQVQGLGHKAFKTGFNNPYDRLVLLEQHEEAKLRRALKGSPNTDFIIRQRGDIIECLRVLVDELLETAIPSLSKLERLAQQTFSESEGAVVLSTVHRAKGKEADRVVILYPESMPAVYARTPEAVRGEACIQFVALTRAKRDLVFVASPPKENPLSLLGGG